MNTQTQPTNTQTSLPAATRLGPVHYTTANLDRQIGFYQDILGFKTHWREGSSAGLGAGGEDLLRLTEVADAKPSRRTTGLYHTAFLVPTRWELAQLLKQIAVTRTPIQGMSNHGTHHAIYLPDAEGNGVELAWDFPQEQWPKTFAEMMANNRGLSPEEVFDGLTDNDASWAGLDAGTTVGHVHLHVSTLAPTRQFYQDVLGFDLPMDMANAPREFRDSAIFFSAGGYHHHIGTNVWQGVGAPPPPPNAIGLRGYTVILPDTAALETVVERVQAAGIDITPEDDSYRLADPAQNGIRLTVG